MSEPLLTVITTTSNIVDADLGDDFTLQVGLLAKQTYPYIEHIVIDNASSDGTEILLKEYKNSGYLNFYSEKDMGKFDAMNKGILRAKGKYIAFLSCDDFFHDIVALEDIVTMMEDANADFCFGPAYSRNDNNGSVLMFPPAIYNIFHLQPCSRQAMVFKRSTLEQLGSFDKKFKMMADYDLMIRLLINKCVGIYFDRIYVTYTVPKEVQINAEQAEIERRYIYYKNYKNLYPMSEDTLDNLINLGEIPKPLLEKLEKLFPPEDKEIFYERYGQVCEFYSEMYKNKKENLRNR